jgi:pseudomonalisin
MSLLSAAHPPPLKDKETRMYRRSTVASLAIFICTLFLSVASAQVQAPLMVRPTSRVHAIDDRRTVTLTGNRYPLARTEYEVGAADPASRMERMILVLQPDAVQQKAIEDLAAAQHDPDSPLYHQWLTPESFAEHFGVARQDLDRVVDWLGTHGFSIDDLPAGGRAIVFSGSAWQVQSAFHTEMRRYNIGGEIHTANAGDPEIPEALAGVVAGIVTLHDFHRQSMHRLVEAVPQYTTGGAHYLAPGDFATIYDVAPLYAGGVDGSGESIAIVGRCNINVSDVQAFRSMSGLPSNNPTVLVNGPNPGIFSSDEELEAVLDVSWSGAVAPKAAVTLVVSASTTVSDGVDLSAQYIVSQNLAPVMSTSFGSCESDMGAAELSFYNSLWQQAAAQGITAFVAAGDSGAAGCDSPSETTATGGLAVNGLCSTPYSVCVGGTEFNEAANAWSSANSASMSSALGYMPEGVWNESGSNGGSGLDAGGGGASAYYAKPSWQTGPGVPADGRRDVPDVSLTASGHDAYLLYIAPQLLAVAGTSASSPSFAGLMALVNQQTASRQGNANTSLYHLASVQASGGLSYFHDITSGNNSVPGLTGFSAGPGYDRATGLGSVDAAVLVNHWTDANSAPTPELTLTVAPGSIAVAAGASGAVTAQVHATGGSSSSPIVLSVSGAPFGVTAAFGSTAIAAPGGSGILTISPAANAAIGSYPLTIKATYGALTETFPLILTITSATACTLTSSPGGITLNMGSASSVQVGCGSVQNGFSAALKLAVKGVPQGVSVTLSTSSILPGSGKATLTITTTSAAPAGTFPLTLTATGGAVTESLSIPLTINPAAAFTMTPSSAILTLMPGSSGRVAVSTANGGSFNSSIALSLSAAPKGVTASFSPATIVAPGDGVSTLTIQTGGSATPGTYMLTIGAAGGGLTKVQTLALVIPGFTFSAGSKTIGVGQGSTAAVGVSIAGLAGGFSSPMALSISSSGGGRLPSGLSATFSPAGFAAPGAGSSMLALTAAANATAGAYSLTLTAAGGNVIETIPLSVSVTAPASFTLHSTFASFNLPAGGIESTQIGLTSYDGFESVVSLSIGELPPGVIVSFQPPSVGGSGGHATMTVQTTAWAAPGNYTIMVTGTGGDVTAALSIPLKIT